MDERLEPLAALIVDLCVKEILHGPLPAAEDIPLLSLDAARQLPPCSRSPGVYFVWDDNRLLYVGQSVDCVARRAAHGSRFAGFCVTQLRTIFHLELEWRYIAEFQPPLNIKGRGRALPEGDTER